MATAIERIRSKNKIAAAAVSNTALADVRTSVAAAASPSVSASQHATAAAASSPPSSTASTLPPTIPCLICSCPAVWATIYEPDAWKCCDCEPPPGGWHWRSGGWSFVRRRLLLVLEYGADKLDPSKWARHFTWESFGRTDWQSFEI